MFRKRTKEELAKGWDSQINQIRHSNNAHNPHREKIEVNLLMGAQRSPLTIEVPRNCNLKILKSIIWFHLKKILTHSEHSAILGFESSPVNYQLDYQLEKGIGQLKQSQNFTPFLQNTRYTRKNILNYKICKLLSEGGFSKVYLMRDYQNGQFVVGKFIQKSGSSAEIVQNEYQLAAQMHNSFIVQTLALVQSQSFYVIVMEYVPGGQLFELLKLHPRMSENHARFYVVQTLLALKYLHNQNIIYRDVKPENIMLDEQGHVKLTDFGLAKKNSSRVYSFCGSLDYMAPEVITDHGYSFEADYYSVGNLLYQLLFGIPPFYQPSASAEETKYCILKVEVPIPQNLGLSETVIDLLKKLLQKDVNKRLGHFGGVDQILEHIWFSSVEIDDYILKSIKPPFNSSMEFQKFSEVVMGEEERQWQELIDKDIKVQQIKAIYHRKNTPVRRFRSVDEEQTTYKGSLPSSPSKESKPRLKSNMSLLYVLTHKRSNSEFSKKDKSQFGPSLAALKSANVSRKVSQYGSLPSSSCSSKNITKKKVRIDDRPSQPHFKNNFINMCGSKKSKENCGVLKKKKEPADRIRFRRS